MAGTGDACTCLPGSPCLAPSLALLSSLGAASDFALARDDLALAAFFAASVLAGCAGADDIASNSTDTAAHSNRRLERAQKRMSLIMNEVKDYYASAKLHPDIIELRNIATVAELTIRCALLRRESRGIHYNLDYPKLNETARDTIVSL